MKHLFWIIPVLLFVACSTEKKPAKPVLDGEDKVLVEVNGSPITAYDLQAALKSSVGRRLGNTPRKATRKKLLESLVHTRLLAQAQEKKLSKKEAAQLEKLVTIYREKLLSQMYLNKSGLMKPVTDEMIARYYLDHPDEFGASKAVKYELIVTQRSLALSERKNVFDKLASATAVENWREWVETQSSEAFPVAYRGGVSTAESLKGKLRKLVMQLAKGEASNVAIIEGKAYVVRAVDVKQNAPEPLIKVKPGIRSRMEAVHMKKALEQAVKTELKTAKVKYL